ncbi:hypothetical protein [Nocardioides limicola]|uniref:hypothetical protein n=1 Tax=Nocardioides limicola TaxID=2803368 RepID=UPI00193C5BAB|nr:hypothetical protein [Nocardioides sp. DJM-14]
MITTTPRRPSRAAALLAGLSLPFLAAGAAQASIPAGWSDPDPVSTITVLWMLVGIPIGIIVLITLLVYLPALAKGERLLPGQPAADDEWFGGPRKGTDELADPDTDESKAGATGGRW